MGLRILHGRNSGLTSLLSISMGTRWFNLKWHKKRVPTTGVKKSSERKAG